MRLNGDFSLYFHIPFCTKKCDYCHFYVIPDQRRYRDLYREALKKEWELRRYLLPTSSPISIYFGGGTPALLGPEAIDEILTWISPPSPCEITLETNPENVSLGLMRAFRACGINRASLGVQAFDNTLLTTLSRTHSAQRSLSAVEECAQAGIHNISIDLMFDLPGQTLHSWQNTLDQAVKLPITHLSLYNLTIEPHTVFFKKKRTLALPDSDLSLQMLQTAVETLKNSGLRRYEISAFAKAGMISKHNTGYWTGRPFLGFGPSAFSYWEGCRFRNIANLNRYAKALERGLDPVDFKETLSARERLKESLAISLRLTDGISLKQWPPEILKGLSHLKTEGFLEKKGSTLRLSAKGLLFHDTVAEHIMSL
jgi:oxygen-independent coproporphyrinogen III oxidase